MSMVPVYCTFVSALLAIKAGNLLKFCSNGTLSHSVFAVVSNFNWQMLDFAEPVWAIFMPDSITDLNDAVRFRARLRLDLYPQHSGQNHYSFWP